MKRHNPYDIISAMGNIIGTKPLLTLYDSSKGVSVMYTLTYQTKINNSAGIIFLVLNLQKR